MYILWSEYNTKPWEVNGGVFYPEDEAALIEMDRMHKDKQRMDAERAAQQAERQKRRRH